MKRTVLSIVALCLFALAVTAQDPLPKHISGGVLNGKAVSLPKPAYPVEAKEANAEGSVAVEVEIDEHGTVASAVALPNDQTVRKNDDGTPAELRELHPALRAAAEGAARAHPASPHPAAIPPRIPLSAAA